MIAAVKGHHAVFAALLFLLPTDAEAADDLGGAARELARKAAAFAGRGESLSATWRNLSGLPGGELTQARTVFENAVRDSGARLVDAGGTVELRITLSENQSQYLLAGEARKGEERQTLISAWERSAPGPAAVPGIALEAPSPWGQDEAIFDV